MEKPKVKFASKSLEGNIYAILNIVKKALTKANRLSEFEPLCASVYASGSYAKALALIRKTIDLYDTDGAY